MRYLLSLLLSLCLSSPAWAGTPTWDISSSSSQSNVTTPSYTHTAGTLTNGIAIISVTYHDNPTSITSVTYGGTGATQIGTEQTVGNVRLSMWRVLSPPAGASTVQANFPESMNQVIISTHTYSNVNQTTPTGTANSANSFDTTAPSECRATITSAVGELVVGICTFSSSTATPASSQNVRAAVLFSTNHNHCAIDAAGAATVDMSCTDAGSRSNIMFGVSLKPSVDGRARQPIIFQ